MVWGFRCFIHHPFQFLQDPLNGSNKLNSPPKVMSKTLMTPPLPTMALLPFFSHNYERGNKLFLLYLTENRDLPRKRCH